MIKYKKSDILTGDIYGAPCRVIVHGVNCQGVMGAGIAKAIKEKWPIVFEKYRGYLEQHSYVPINGFNDTILGSINYVNITPHGSELNHYVINAFTQNEIRNKSDPYKDRRRYVSYDAVDDCMEKIAIWYKEKKINTALGMPKIGCGLGGGEWSVVESIIKYRLKGITVVVYEL